METTDVCISQMDFQKGNPPFSTTWMNINNVVVSKISQLRLYFDFKLFLKEKKKKKA
jgi:hypothetical protein